MTAHNIAKASEIPPGQRKLVTILGREVGVFNVDGHFYAVRNSCPHQRGPVCKGRLRGTMLPSPPQEYTYGLDGLVLSCPWHGWEFDIRSGEAVFDPKGVCLRTYKVEVQAPIPPPVETYQVDVVDGDVILYV